MSGIVYTVYVGFAPPTQGQREALLDLRPECVIFGLDDEDDDARGADGTDYADTWRVRPQWGKDGAKLKAELEWCADHGLFTGAHVWGRPVVDWTRRSVREMIDLACDHGLSRVVIDHERHGERLNPARGGYTTFDEYATRLNAMLSAPPTDGAHPWWPEVELALYGFPTLRMRTLLAMPCVQGATSMVYGDRQHCGIDPMPTYEGSIQRYSLAKRPDQTIRQGVGLYGQDRPGVLGPAMIRLIIKGLHARGQRHIALWSLRNLDKQELRALLDVRDELEVS